ncbi:hypothetical protein Glove_816420g6 [Diversispora epigaea]|uniref:T6SS Phospholipase effector Tle1-like catalytic domain-containing protein n=1 Tax=Diversispora epigaea TaxID=1348612 RepID=A0A397FZL8_9GLOM|nr:hypothetical protein Glove_816420g6 [Diversispora epigaea]
MLAAIGYTNVSIIFYICHHSVFFAKINIHLQWKKNSEETINIVVLCDGTSNWPTIETNVYKLHTLLLSYYEAYKTRVRCVAGMIRNCGRLRYNNKELINRAYELYHNKNPNHDPNARESKSFRNSFSHPLESTGIKFLGLKSEECKKNEKCKNSEKCVCKKLEEI